MIPLNTINDLKSHGDLAMVLFKIRMTLMHNKAVGFIVHADEDKITFIKRGDVDRIIDENNLDSCGFEWDEGRDVMDIFVDRYENDEWNDYHQLPYNNMTEILCGGEFYGDVVFIKQIL